MEILILGAGNIGKAITYDLSKDYTVCVGDSNKTKLEEISNFANTKNIDARNKKEMVETMKNFDLIVGALPGKLGFKTIEAAIEAGRDIVDVSFMPENPLSLDKKAKKENISIIVDAGFGPGVSNLLMGRIACEMDKLKKAIIRIGGLPKRPKPPLFYKITWSPYDLIEEYTRKARLKKNGKLIEVDPLKDIKKVKIKGKEFEEFYSDGLRTLLQTIDVDTLEETTLRWKGHLQKMKVLRDLGFLKPGNLDHTLDVILPYMKFKGKDFSIMDIKAEGFKNGENTNIHYYFYDEADEKFSSMARSTGFSTAAMVRLLIKNSLECGVIPPEKLGENITFYKEIVSSLKEKGIKLEKTRY